ncbi:radical SAM protein (plasmid) [Streptomyces jietaisiensis]|uniref:radical SAM/SPASM domain-containing protein n=1 Tax=Streptomyces griseoaurantiacus TaxID=68213 RepID=UPI002F907338
MPESLIVDDLTGTRPPLFAGPFHVDLDLTNACNLRCSHCSVSSDKPLPGELDTVGMLALLDQLHDLGVLTLTVAGGEPLLRPDAIEILEHACSLPGWSVTVITNGTYFSEKMVQALLSRCPGLTVNVSIDGSTPERFDFLRHRLRRTPKAQEALFKQVIDGTRFAVESGLKVHANFALTRATRFDLEDTYELVMELGVRDLLAIKFFPGGRGLDHLRQMEFPYREWAQVMVELTEKKAAGELPRLALAVVAAWEFYLPLVDAGMDIEAAEKLWSYRAPLRESFYRQNRTVGDPSGIADLNVVANGEVYPITLMSGNPAALCGNFRGSSLATVWEKSRLLQDLRGLELEDLPKECSDCRISQLCGGGSRARALVHTDSLQGADLTCPILGDSGGIFE